MGIFSQHDQLDAMIDILDREWNALLNGKFDVLRRLAPEKDRIFKQGLANVQPNDFTKIKQRIARNQSILDAAARGIRSAVHALDENRAVRASFQTYDQSGKRTKNTRETTEIAHRF